MHAQWLNGHHPLVSFEEFLTYLHWWEHILLITTTTTVEGVSQHRLEKTPHYSVEEFLTFQESCSHFFPRDPSVPIILWNVQVKLMYDPQPTIKIFQFQNLKDFLKSQVKTV